MCSGWMFLHGEFFQEVSLPLVVTLQAELLVTAQMGVPRVGGLH